MIHETIAPTFNFYTLGTYHNHSNLEPKLVYKEHILLLELMVIKWLIVCNAN